MVTTLYTIAHTILRIVRNFTMMLSSRLRTSSFSFFLLFRTVAYTSGPLITSVQFYILQRLHGVHRCSPLTNLTWSHHMYHIVKKCQDLFWINLKKNINFLRYSAGSCSKAIMELAGGDSVTLKRAENELYL